MSYWKVQLNQCRIDLEKKEVLGLARRRLNLWRVKACHFTVFKFEPLHF
jgi:hypothetical protein